MHTSDIRLETPALIQSVPTDEAPHRAPRRLIVVLLGADEEAALASRIMVLARQRALQVVLFGIALDPANKSELRRKLVTIAAFLRDEMVAAGSLSRNDSRSGAVEIRIEDGKDWIQQLRSEVQSTDLLACYTGQGIGARQRALSDVLASNLDVPIYSFSGLRPPRSPQGILAGTVSWIGSVGLIGAFLMLQARIVQAFQGGTQTVLLLLTVCAEVGLIWLLNALVGQS